jgi:arabinose-5-phosphate isomerase
LSTTATSILALSYSGESEELLNLLPALKRFPVKISRADGQFANRRWRGTVTLSLNVQACRRRRAPSTSRRPPSTTAMLVLGDALAMVVLAARGFTEKDFAKYHPSGAIGRAHAAEASATSCAAANAMRWPDENLSGQGRAAGDDARAKSGSLSVDQRARKIEWAFLPTAISAGFMAERRQSARRAAEAGDDPQSRSAFLHGCPGRRGLEDFQRAEH